MNLHFTGIEILEPHILKSHSFLQVIISLPTNYSKCTKHDIVFLWYQSMYKIIENKHESVYSNKNVSFDEFLKRFWKTNYARIQ